MAGQYPGDPVVVALRQRFAHGIPRKMTLSAGQGNRVNEYVTNRYSRPHVNWDIRSHIGGGGIDA
jgi:hypothetical protein